MILSIKLLISQIIIAKKKNKKILKLVKTKHTIMLLNVLWNGGFIYGYTIAKAEEHCIVFLKYGAQPRATMFTEVKFTKKSICFHDLYNLVQKQPGIFCILITSKGITSHRECLAKGCGGVLVITTN